MSLHNGTIYRWNRPVYAVVDGMPHLRVENRVLPAGPTVADIMANAAFYYGLVRALAEAQRPVWTQMSFATAAENLHEAARTAWTPSCTGRAWARCPPPNWCSAACCRWPAMGWPGGASDPDLADRLLGIIEQRCLTGQTGAAWQVAATDAFGAQGPTGRRRCG